MSARIKGMVLAAGFGNRLRPVSETWPKPLIPFLGATPLTLALARLKRLGVKRIAVNAHYLADQVQAVVEENVFALDLHYSFEPEILGTGGCYNPIRKWLGKDHLLVLNGDIVSDIDLERLVQVHFSSSSLATMAFLPEVVPGEKGFHVLGDRVLCFGDKGPAETNARNFACVQVLSPEFLDRLPQNGSFCVIEHGYRPAIREGIPLFSMLHEGMWHDLRNPKFYREAVEDVLSRPGDWKNLGLADALGAEKLDFKYRPKTKDKGPAFCAGDAALQELGSHVVVEKGAKVSPNAHLSHTIVLPGAAVADATLERCVVTAQHVIQST